MLKHKQLHIHLSFCCIKYNAVVFVLCICILAIQIWVDQKKLTLNPSKTECMVIENITQRKKIGHILFPVELLILTRNLTKRECGNYLIKHL